MILFMASLGVDTVLKIEQRTGRNAAKQQEEDRRQFYPPG
jgi:hypothetical protein